MLEIRVFDKYKSRARSYLDHHLCGVSVEEAIESVADELNPLIEKHRELQIYEII